MAERKLRSIYDAIDSRNYRGAVKLCGKKDICKLDIVKILKAHALERLDKREEALALCREVQANKPTDDAVLSTMLLVYKHAGAADEAIDCYENAVKLQPGNEERSNGLFLCYVRKFLYAKQQRLAMQMYKQFKRPKYAYWASLSMLLQVRAGGAANLLILGERMLLQVLRKDPTPSIDAIKLAIEILTEQGKHANAVEVFQEFLRGEKAEDSTAVQNVSVRMKQPREEGKGAEEEEVDKMTMQLIDELELEAKLLENANQMHESSDVLRTLVQEHAPDNWALLCSFLRTKLGKLSDEGTVDKDVAAEMQGVVSQLQEKQFAADPGRKQAEDAKEEGGSDGPAGTNINRSSRVHRGPFLIEIELAHHCFCKGADLVTGEEGEAGDGTPATGRDLSRLLCGYVRQFGTKQCCFADVQTYLLHFQAAPQDTGGAENGQLASLGVKLAQEYARRKVCHDGQQTLPSSPAPAQGPSVATLSSFPSVHASERQKLVQEMQQLVKINSVFEGYGKEPSVSEIAKGKKQLRMYITGLQVLRYIGMHEPEQIDVQQAKVLVAEILDVYQGTLSLNAAAEGGQREVQVGDELVLIACHLLRSIGRWPASSSRPQEQSLFEIACILEYALERSGYNFHMKLLLMQTYSALAACEAAVKYYNDVEVKQIQLDSLSWIILDSFFCNCFFQEAHRACRDICLMHHAHNRDMPDFIGKAYRCGNLMSVLDFVTFLKSRMENSHQLAVARAELGALELLDNSKSFVEAEKHLQNQVLGAGDSRLGIGEQLSAEAAQQLSMNQDFTVMADWDCPLSSFKGGRTAAKHVSSCHHRQLSLHCLQATSLAPRLLLLCTQKSSVAAIGGKVAEYCQHVDGLLQDEEQIGEACELSTCGWNMSQSAFKATLQTFCALDADDAQTTSECWEKAVLELKAISGVAGKIADSVRSSLFVSLLTSRNESAENQTRCVRAAVLAEVSIFVEKAGHWSTLLLHVLSKYCSKKAKRGKKGKKGKKAATDATTVDDSGAGNLQQAQAAFKEAVDAVTAMFETVHRACTFPTGDGSSALFSLENAVPLLQGGGEGEKWGAVVRKKIESSHELSLDRLKNLLSDKLALLRSL